MESEFEEMEMVGLFGWRKRVVGKVGVVARESTRRVVEWWCRDWRVLVAI